MAGNNGESGVIVSERDEPKVEVIKDLMDESMRFQEELREKHDRSTSDQRQDRGIEA